MGCTLIEDDHCIDLKSTVIDVEDTFHFAIFVSLVPVDRRSDHSKQLTGISAKTDLIKGNSFGGVDPDAVIPEEMISDRHG